MFYCWTWERVELCEGNLSLSSIPCVDWCSWCKVSLYLVVVCAGVMKLLVSPYSCFVCVVSDFVVVWRLFIQSILRIIPSPFVMITFYVLPMAQFDPKGAFIHAEVHLFKTALPECPWYLVRLLLTRILDHRPVVPVCQVSLVIDRVHVLSAGHCDIWHQCHLKI